MKKYESPDSEIILFDDVDIITNSTEPGEMYDPDEETGPN